MTKPDFSGMWTLNVADSALSHVVAPVVQGGFLHITHQEPTVSVHFSITMEGKPFEFRFERSSSWEGDVLAFTDRVPTPGGELNISFRYQLHDGGRRLHAAETLRGAGQEQGNLWVFDREEASG